MCFLDVQLKDRPYLSRLQNLLLYIKAWWSLMCSPLHTKLAFRSLCRTSLDDTCQPTRACASAMPCVPFGFVAPRSRPRSPSLLCFWRPGPLRVAAVRARTLRVQARAMLACLPRIKTQAGQPLCQGSREHIPAASAQAPPATGWVHKHLPQCGAGSRLRVSQVHRVCATERIAGSWAALQFVSRRRATRGSRPRRFWDRGVGERDRRRRGRRLGGDTATVCLV